MSTDEQSPISSTSLALSVVVFGYCLCYNYSYAISGIRGSICGNIDIVTDAKMVG
jgi:hypothetical protein